MNATKGQFETMVENEVKKIKGNYTPVKTSFLRRLLTKFLKWSALRNRFAVASAPPWLLMTWPL